MARPEPLPARGVADRRLLPGRVLRLACTAPGRLLAREGQLWITHEAAPGGRAAEDRFLSRGESLQVAPGEVLVVSAANPRYGMAAFDWTPQVRRAVRPAPVPAPRESGLLQALARLAGGEAALLA